MNLLHSRLDRFRRRARGSEPSAVQMHNWAGATERLGFPDSLVAIAATQPDLARYMVDPRAYDWHYLLPRTPRGDALCLGGALSPVPLALAGTCKQVVVLAPAAESRLLKARVREDGRSNVEAIASLSCLSRRFELVAVLRRAPGFSGEIWPAGRIRRATRLVKSGGDLYAEVDCPSLLLPPIVLRYMLRTAGFTRIAFYWPRPTFNDCEMLMQLGDRRLQDYYAGYMLYATSLPRRLARLGIKAAAALGLFEWILPGYAVVARRGG